jgi:hypothetical protein
MSVSSFVLGCLSGRRGQASPPHQCVTAYWLPLVPPRRTEGTARAGARRPAPNALVPDSVPMLPRRAERTSRAITPRPTPLAMAVVVPVLVLSIRSEGTAGAIAPRSAMSAFGRHGLLLLFVVLLLVVVFAAVSGTHRASRRQKGIFPDVPRPPSATPPPPGRTRFSARTTPLPGSCRGNASGNNRGARRHGAPACRFRKGTMFPRSRGNATSPSAPPASPPKDKGRHPVVRPGNARPSHWTRPPAACSMGWNGISVSLDNVGEQNKSDDDT